LSESFLRKLAAELSVEFPKGLYIFPNKRSLASFRSELLTLEYQGVLPKLISVNEFIESISKLKLAEVSDQRSILAAILQERAFQLTDRQVDLLLGDWNTMGVHGIDPPSTWKNALALYELSQGFQSQENYKSRIQVLKAMSELESSFEEEMRKRGLANHAMMLRRCLEQLDSQVFEESIRLIGFSKFNPLEWELFESLRQKGELTYHSDLHRFYMQAKGHEASRVFQNIPEDSIQDLSPHPSEFVSVACRGQNHQAKVVQELVGKFLTEGEEQVGVILLDESFAWLALNYLSEYQSEINCSSGIDVRFTEVFQAAQNISVRQNSKISQNSILEKVKEGSSRSNPLEAIAWKQFQESIGQWFRKHGKEDMDASDWRRFLLDFQKSRLVVEGNPNARIQMMGLLESRALNFERLIFCSFNEGELQGRRNLNSWIPGEMQRSLHLPSVADRDALFAYHVYRLLPGVKSLHCLYLDSGMDIRQGERSRIISQLHYTHSLKATQNGIASLPANTTDTILLSRVEWVERFKAFLSKGLSPTALNVLLKDRDKFSLQYLLGVNPSDSLDSMKLHRDLGIYLHRILENIYKPWVGTQLDASKLESVDLSRECQLALDDAMRQILAEKPFLEELVLRSVANFINSDIQDLKRGNEIHLLSLEERLSLTLGLDGFDMKIKGFIDRIDRRNGKIRVVDYKTGRVEEKDLKYKSVEEMFSASKVRDKLHQLFIYALLLEHSAYKIDGVPELMLQTLLVHEAKPFVLRFPSLESYKSDLQLYRLELMQRIHQEIGEGGEDISLQLFPLVEEEDAWN
jgi:hypothetical protein